MTFSQQPTEIAQSNLPGPSAELVDDTFRKYLEGTAQSDIFQSELRRHQLGNLFACSMVVAFGALDWMVSSYVHPFNLTYFLMIRTIQAALMAVCVLILFIKPGKDIERIERISLLTCASATVSISLMTLEYRGLASPYSQGISLGLIFQGIFIPQHWRRGVVQSGIVAGAYPITISIASLVRADIMAQFHDPMMAATFAQNLTFIFSTAAISVLGGHIVWSLRQKVYESRLVGRYRLKNRIGKGGMGEVWSADHFALKREVAIKILKSKDGTSHEAKLRFKREVDAMTELRHPNAVRVFDFGVTPDGLWYYVMELLTGQNLLEMVQQQGPLSAPHAIQLLRQASGALGEAHSRGIVHRDIKPENLFVVRLSDGTETVKVLDFGIARFADSSASGSLTMEGWVGGTPAYISPEVARGEVANAPADVYAMGAVLYYLLTGTPPFVSDSPVQLLYSHLMEEPVPPSMKSNFSFSAELDAIVLRCLSKNPAERYTDANELTAALDAIRFAYSF